jgi:hypothetical protein
MPNTAEEEEGERNMETKLKEENDTVLVIDYQQVCYLPGCTEEEPYKGEISLESNQYFCSCGSILDRYDNSCDFEDWPRHVCERTVFEEKIEAISDELKKLLHTKGVATKHPNIFEIEKKYIDDFKNALPLRKQACELFQAAGLFIQPKSYEDNNS